MAKRKANVRRVQLATSDEHSGSTRSSQLQSDSVVMPQREGYSEQELAEKPKKIYLSYHHEEATAIAKRLGDWVQQLCDAIRQQKHKLSTRREGPAGLQSANRFIVLVTRNCFASREFVQELVAIWERRSAAEKIIFLVDAAAAQEITDELVADRFRDSPSGAAVSDSHGIVGSQAEVDELIRLLKQPGKVEQGVVIRAVLALEQQPLIELVQEITE